MKEIQVAFTPTQSSDIEWLDTNEAAQHLRMSVGSFKNEVSYGNIPYYKIGRRNRYLKSELNNLVLKNRRGQGDN